MAPKKKEVQKLSLGEFLNDSLGAASGSWADEVEDTYASGTQSFPSTDRRTGGGYSSYGGGNTNDRGYSSIHDNLPVALPDKPPYTAHLGNLSWDATEESITDFFDGCNVKNVRIILDRESKRPKGFAYAEFNDLDGLKKALTRDGENFEGRRIRVTVAEPARGGGGGFGDRGGGDSFRELDWGAKRQGPLADLPGRDSNRRNDFGERRPREFQGGDDKPAREITWERRGPLSPRVPEERPGSREGSRPRTNEGRTDSFRNDRKASPAAWGPSEGRQDSRPPRREFAERSERPERVPTAAEKDFNWRNNMRPAEPSVKSPTSREGSEAPSSPAPAAALPAGRPKLNLAKRTVSENPEAPSAAGSSKASPFGAARPIDTAAREREIEEKRLKALKEAEEKAKEEKLAQEAAAKEAAEKAEKAAADAAAKAKSDAEAAAAAPKEAPQEGAAPSTEEQKAPAKTREPREPRAPREPREPRESREPREDAPKSRAVESGNWRRGPPEPSRGNAPGPRRGGPGRGPRNDSGRGSRANGNGPASTPQSPSVEKTPASPTVDEDGWTTVTQPVKGRRGQGNRPIVS